MDWKERIEEAITDEDGLCCDRINCADCILVDANGGCGEPDPDDVTLPFLYRHVFATVKDFTDRGEIRARVAEMLDDDAREKFLGKAETYRMATSDVGPCGFIHSHNPEDSDYPKLIYYIREGESEFNTQVGAAFRDKDTRDLVLRLLNGETNA